MWDNINATALIAAGAQIVLLIVFLVKMNSKTDSALILAEKADKRADEAYNKIDLQIDVLSNRYGDTIAAIRELVNMQITMLRKELTDDQKYVRDTFVRHDLFKDLQSEIRQISEKIDDRFERVENKIDERMKHG